MTSQQFKAELFKFSRSLGFTGTGKLKVRRDGECLQFFQLEMHPRAHSWTLVFGVSFDVSASLRGVHHCPLQFWLAGIPHDIAKHGYVNNCLLNPADQSMSESEKLDALKQLVLDEIEPLFRRLNTVDRVAKEYAAGNLRSVAVRYDLLELIREKQSGVGDK